MTLVDVPKPKYTHNSNTHFIFLVQFLGNSGCIIKVKCPTAMSLSR